MNMNDYSYFLQKLTDILNGLAGLTYVQLGQELNDLLNDCADALEKESEVDNTPVAPVEVVDEVVEITPEAIITALDTKPAKTSRKAK